MLRLTALVGLILSTSLACGPAVEEGADAGAGADAVAAVDAATGQDAGTGVDSAITSDAAAGRDSAGGVDSAAARDAASGQDSSSGVDGARPDAAVGSDAAPPPGVELNVGWIGGGCSDPSDCSDASGASCETTGFPGGFCTVDCDIYCPDAPGGYGAGTGNTITRCIVDDMGDGRCAGGCDFDQSPSGCRPGYACVMRQRDGQPDSLFPVCLPADVQRWPGEPAPANDIGAACSGDLQCAHLSCLGLPGGYCTKTMCDVAGCPAGSRCFTFQSSDMTACLDDCGADGDCREGEGYFCDTDQVCWVDTTATTHPLWDPSVGPTDCTAALNAGLSACEDAVDYFVVVNKAARNLAVCDSSGGNPHNFSAGLGDAPVGDKQWQGDEKTPEGVFYVSYRQEVTTYGRAWLLNYPNAEDAARGLSQGQISQGQHDDIVAAENSCGIPPSNTAVGGAIEIHGRGGEQDWTDGCIAIADSETAILWSLLDVHDTIVVLP